MSKNPGLGIASLTILRYLLNHITRWLEEGRRSVFVSVRGTDERHVSDLSMPSSLGPSILLTPLSPRLMV